MQGLLGGLLAADYSTARSALLDLCDCDVLKLKTPKKQHGGSTLRGAKAPLKIMDALPDEIFRNIVKTLNSYTLCRLSCVSKSLKVLADDDEVWTNQTGMYTKENTRDIVARAESALIHSACMWSEVVEKFSSAKKHLIDEAEKRTVGSMQNTVHGTLVLYSGPWGRGYPVRERAVEAWMTSPFLREERLQLELIESEIFVRKGTFDTDTFRLRNVHRALRK